MRHLLGQTPQLSNKIKILAFDEATLFATNGVDMTLPQVAILLENIAKRRPKVIMRLDKTFSLNPGTTPEELRALHVIQSLKVPVNIASYPENRQKIIKNRMIVDDERYSLARFLEL